MRRIPILICLLTSLLILNSAQVAGAAEFAPRMTAVWFGQGTQPEDAEAIIEVTLDKSYPAEAVIPVSSTIHSGEFVGNAEVSLQVVDALQHETIRGVQRLDLISGENPCLFSIDAASLATGEYTLIIDVAYQRKMGDTSYTIPFQKVDSDQMIAQLTAYKLRLETLEAQQGALAASEKSSYLRTRLLLAQESVEKATADAVSGDWHALDDKLHYLRYVVNSAYASLAMGNVMPEHDTVIVPKNLQDLKVSDGAFVSEGQPVYLFGVNVPDITPQVVERISLYGLQFAAFSLGPESTRDMELFRAQYDPVFEAATRHNIALAVQLHANNQEPHIGATEIRTVFQEHLSRVLPYLQGKQSVFAVNVVDNPRFHFDGEAVRDAYINFVKARYPDRIDLNRAWRSHLATYDEIEIWGDFPAYSYQNRRAFQFDWQQFHQTLGSNYFTWASTKVKELAPGLPLMVTLPNNAFTHGETRYGVDREYLLGLTDLAGCTSGISPLDKNYSIAYPNQSAYYTLIRSMQPGKPIVNLNDTLEFTAGMDSLWLRSYVQTVMWEAVMSGLKASAFSYESGLFDHPDAIDAMATATLDINRLAKVVNAFDRAPRDIAILFSKSSKIFDDGEPHLDSAWFAYEGTSFGGYGTRFVTEAQIANGALNDIRVLVLPETPAVADVTFEMINEYALNEGNLIRVGTPIPYNEHGFSRRGTIKHTSHTILVRGLNLPTEYLHAMDAIIDVGNLPTIPRAVNGFGYPIEGVKSRHVQLDGKDYLYIINLRKEPVHVDLFGHLHRGRDLIRGRMVDFPRILRPLDPMLIQLESMQETVALSATVPED